MFEFKLSYREPGFHKEDDPPFSFPPDNISSLIDKNLVEVRGKNGTGKSTLLNVLALAFGYHEEDQELKTKPALKEKLFRLAENQSMFYHFKVNRGDPFPTDLRLERAPKQKKKVFVNNKQVSPDALDKYDVIFLTEDDPEKVVTITVGKLMSYFGSVEKKCYEITNLIGQHQRVINMFKNTENRIKETSDLIKTTESEKSLLEKELNEQQELLNIIIERDDTEEHFNIIAREKEITKIYNDIKEEYDKIRGSKYDEVFSEYDSLNREMNRNSQKLYNVIHEDIKDLCRKFKYYNIDVDYNKIFKNDYSQIWNLRDNVETNKDEESEIDFNLVEGMIKLFQRYRHDVMIPLLDQQVSSALENLYRIRDKISYESLIPLLNEFNKKLKERDRAVTKIKDISEKITKYEETLETIENLKQIQKDYNEAEADYLNLQQTLLLGKRDIISKWEKVKKIKGNNLDIKNKIEDIKTSIRIKEHSIVQNKTILTNLKENKSISPEYYEKENELKTLYEQITALRTNFLNWNNILLNPRKAKQDFSRLKDSSSFGISEYKGFSQAIGVFLGDQFEPVDFAGTTHGIKFYDIENSMFLTDDDRQIYISDLSQGQSKVTSLISSLRRLSPEKQGIILIDEIADLDPENMAMVKKELSDYYQKGLIMLAVLVRPISEFDSEAVEIYGWT